MDVHRWKNATISVVQLNRIMSGNVTTSKQRSCTTLDCEHETYIVDIFSCMEPGHHGHNESRKQVFLYVTKAEGNGRKAFLQVIIIIDYKKTILPSTYDVPIIYPHVKRIFRAILARSELPHSWPLELMLF